MPNKRFILSHCHHTQLSPLYQHRPMPIYTGLCRFGSLVRVIVSSSLVRVIFSLVHCELRACRGISWNGGTIGYHSPQQGDYRPTRCARIIFDFFCKQSGVQTVWGDDVFIHGGFRCTPILRTLPKFSVKLAIRAPSTARLLHAEEEKWIATAGTFPETRGLIQCGTHALFFHKEFRQ